MTQELPSAGLVPQQPLRDTTGTTDREDVIFPPTSTLHPEVKQASDLLKRLFQGFNGSFTMRLWNGTNLKLGNAEHDDARPEFTLVCHSPGVVRSMVLGRDRLRLAEAYFRGAIDVEGDFLAALSLRTICARSGFLGATV